MQAFSAWPASYNQDARDLGDTGFFTFKEEPVYNKNNYFIKYPANKKCFYGEINHTM